MNKSDLHILLMRYNNATLMPLPKKELKLQG